jgi:hypothetical protein
VTQEAGTPAGFWDRVEQIAERAVAKYVRAGLLNNASISGGPGLRVAGGSKMIVQHPDGSTLMRAGIYDANHTIDLADGSYQPVYMLRRQDGTLALSMYDPSPGSGGYNQFLAWWDRSGHIIISDDTDSGQGLARPYLPGVGYLAQARHWPGTTSTTFEPLYRVRHDKQHPRLYVQAWGTCDTAGGTGEIAVFVDGVQMGSTQSVAAGSVTEFVFGPTAVSGTFGAMLNVELQARMTGGSGQAQTCFSLVEGRQS